MTENRNANRSQNLIDIETIIVAYAMSRLDNAFLKRFGFGSWSAAFAEIGQKFARKPASIKNLRDEFDPVHSNKRRGWHKRPLRPNRQRVLSEFCEASDEALTEIVDALLADNAEVRDLVTRPLARARSKVESVAERLRTGRLAEDFFLKNSKHICGIAKKNLRDVRQEACGFDFGVLRAKTAIEVKGIKKSRGDVLFTDHEWHQANRRQQDYWLVIVGSLERKPKATLLKHPASTLRPTLSIREQTVLSWRATIDIDG